MRLTPSLKIVVSQLFVVVFSPKQTQRQTLASLDKGYFPLQIEGKGRWIICAPAPRCV